MAGREIWAEELSREGEGGLKADSLVSSLTALGGQRWGEWGSFQWLSPGHPGGGVVSIGL